MRGDVGVVVITVHIGAYAVAVIIADTGAGSRRSGAITIGVDEVIDGCGVAIVAGVAGSMSGEKIIIITIDIGADAVAVCVSDAGARGWSPNTVTIGIDGIIDGGGVAIVTRITDIGG